MKIHRKDCPENFFSRPQDYTSKLFIATVNRWDVVNMALGKGKVYYGGPKETLHLIFKILT